MAMRPSIVEKADQKIRLNTYVALKITTAKSSATENETKILEHLSLDGFLHPGQKHVTTLLDSFEHHGPNGIHRCLVFDVMGPSTATMFEHLPPRLKVPRSEPEELNHQDRGRYPVWMAKSILRQTLLGIDFLHKNGVAHGDLQPGNILYPVKDLSHLREDQVAQVDLPELAFQTFVNPDGVVQFVYCQPDPMDELTTEHTDPSLPRYIAYKQPIFDFVDLDSPLLIRIADLGSAFSTSHPPESHVTPLALRSPELILGDPISEAQDIWSFGCLVFEFLTGRKLFHLIPAPPFDAADENGNLRIPTENGNHELVDMDGNWAAANENGNKATNTNDTKRNYAEYKALEREYNTEEDASIDDDHLLQLAHLLGPLPTDFRIQYPRSDLYFDEQGRLTHHHVHHTGDSDSDTEDVGSWPSLEGYFDQEKGADLAEDEAEVVKQLLRSILQVDATKRPSASELLAHPWFAEPNLNGM